MLPCESVAGTAFFTVIVRPSIVSLIVASKSAAVTLSIRIRCLRLAGEQVSPRGDEEVFIIRPRTVEVSRGAIVAARTRGRCPSSRATSEIVRSWAQVSGRSARNDGRR